MGTTRGWLLLLLGQVVVVAAIGVGITAMQSRAAASGGEVPAAVLIPLRVVAVVALVGIVACIPLLMLRWFTAAQLRIGNAGHPMVDFLERHETGTVRVVWAVWALGALVALPVMLRDVREDRRVARIVDAPGGVVPAGTEVVTPRAGTPIHAAILDALRAHVKASGQLDADHLRMANGWAFVRATEVVSLEGGERQETDLTAAALLELQAAPGTWQVIETWTLPGDARLPLAEFTRRLAVYQASVGLPAALFPDDLAPAPNAPAPNAAAR